MLANPPGPHMTDIQATMQAMDSTVSQGAGDLLTSNRNIIVIPASLNPGMSRAIKPV